MDADTFSTLSMSVHVLEYIKRIFTDKITKENIENLFEITCTGILLYIITLLNNSRFYFKETSHPHPIIRVFNIIFTFIDYSNQHPILQSYNIRLDTKKTFRQTIINTMEIEKSAFNSSLADNFIAIISNKDYAKGIEEYIEEIRRGLLHYIGAVDKWNERSIHFEN